MSAHRLALAGLIVLTACGERQPGAPSPSPSSDAATAATNTTTAPAASTAGPTRAIGTTSALSAQTSPLTGTVTGFAVTVTDTSTIVALAADTLFAFDKAVIEPAAEANLARTADLVAKGAPGAVRIVGHTDAKGDDAYNLELSDRRARAIAAWLRARPALSGHDFQVEAAGETQPVAANTRPDGSDDPAGRARNRRVEVIIPK